MFWTWLYRNRRVSQKIFINYILVIVVTIATLSAIVISISSNTIEKLADDNTLQMIKQVNSSLDGQILKYEDIMHYISQDKAIISYIEGANNSYEMALKGLSIYEDRNKGIVGIIITSQFDRELSISMERLSRDPLRDEEWYKKAEVNKESLQLISNPIGRNVRTLRKDITSDDVVSLSKAIIDDEDNVIGVIMMDIDLRVFEEIIRNTVIGKDGFVFVQGEKGQVVYSKKNDIVYHIKPTYIEGGSNTITVNIKGSDYKVSYIESAYTHWKTVGVFSLTEALVPVKQLQILILMLSFVIITVSFIVSYYLANSITRPIAKLKELMQRAEEGELELEYDSIYNDEIGQLGHSFNTMIVSMQGLISMVYEEQKKKREAELEIFRAQIKPHFLYNTLDTIHWLVKENKNEESIKVIKALTKLFRITLSKGKEYIPINDEINHIVSYLTIQLVRYKDKFDYDIDCSEKIRSLNITKIILQPIIENAIYHGIKEKRSKGHIHVGFSILNGMICIVINDDGVGIPEPELKRINEVLRREKQRENEYGLVNVNEKIKLAYGDCYGVTLESQIEVGTKITILHPII